MIRRLHLKKFGRFTGADFKFRPVTLFIGENESGKTTIFDAIFSAVCSLGERSVREKQISRRYGPPRERSCEIEWEGAPLEMGEDEFINLHAIRSGDMSVEIASGRTWLDKIKSSIFTGGIDPAKLRGELNRSAAEKGNFAHVNEMKERKSLLDAKRRDYELLLKKREELLKKRGEFQSRDRELASLGAGEGGHVALIRSLEEGLSLQKMIGERKHLGDILAHLARGEGLKRETEILSRFSDDRSPEIARLQNGIAAAEKAHAAEEARVGEISKNLKAKTALLEEARTEQSKKRPHVEVAAGLLGALRDAPLEVASRRVNPLGMAAAGAFLAAGVAGFFLTGRSGLRFDEFMGPVELGIAVLVVCAAIAILVIIFSIRPSGTNRRGSSEALVRNIRDEWRARTGGTLSSEGLDGIRLELVSKGSEADSLARAIARLEEEARDAGSDLEAGRERLDVARKLREEAIARLSGFFTSMGVVDQGEYAAKAGAYRKAREALDGWRERTDDLLRSHGKEDDAALQTACTARITALDIEIAGIDPAEKEKTAGEIRRMEQQLRQEREALEKLRTKKNMLEKEIHTGKGEVQGSLGTIPDQIVAAEGEIAGIENEIARLELDRRASALARDIFGTLAESSDIQLQGLGDDIALHFGEILPGLRRVAISALNEKSITVEDAGGEMRPIEHLSRGTLDSFYLAARFAMALRSREDAGILLLDEPFHALDQGRESKALELLRRVHERHGWQIVLFSKEPDMEGKARAIFSDVAVHQLSGAAGNRAGGPAAGSS